MNLFGFSSSHIREGYNRSDSIPKLDKVKFLSLYCNLVDNREDNEFLTNVFIKGGISEQVTTSSLTSGTISYQSEFFKGNFYDIAKISTFRPFFHLGEVLDFNGP